MFSHFSILAQCVSQEKLDGSFLNSNNHRQKSLQVVLSTFTDFICLLSLFSILIKHMKLFSRKRRAGNVNRILKIGFDKTFVKYFLKNVLCFLLCSWRETDDFNFRARSDKYQCFGVPTYSNINRQIKYYRACVSVSAMGSKYF